MHRELIAQEPSSEKPWIRIPGEFEKQRALVVSVCDWQPHHRQVLTQIAEKTAGHIDLLVLYNTPQQKDAAVQWFQAAQVPTQHVYFTEMQLDTIWVRDFAPILAESAQGPLALDFYYYGGARPNDERMPARWCKRTNCELHEIKWTVQGGNLICNGEYCAVTTTKVFEENRITFPRPLPGQNPVSEGRKIFTQDLVKQTNLAKLVLLEPLQSEATKHADMFATFVSATDVVVAQVDAQRDPANARILDRNAAALKKLTIGDKPVRVHRLPIPPRRGDAWSAYTNIIFANDVVLLPIFEDDPPSYIDYAKQFYGQLLPGRSIETIDITSMRNLQGALHCLSFHVPEFAELPRGAVKFEQVAQSE